MRVLIGELPGLAVQPHHGANVAMTWAHIVIPDEVVATPDRYLVTGELANGA
jgi:hypothetical protein